MLSLFLQKHHNPKQIVTTLTFELCTRLKVRVNEVGLLLRFLYRYNPVCILKLATSIMLPAPLNWGLLLALKHTPFETIERKKPRLEALILQERKRRFTSHSTHFAYKVKLVRGPFLGLFIFHFIQIKWKINKKSRSTILTR